MSDLPNDLEELYCRYGRTAEMAQVMELEAGNFLLAHISSLFNPQRITQEQSRLFQALMKDIDRRTFGYLLNQIRKSVTVSDEIEKTVCEALEKRNYLIHSFFKTHNFAIHSEEGRKTMNEELDEIYRTLNLAHAFLSGMTYTCNEAFGWPNISKEEVTELMNGGKSVDI